MRLQSAWLCLPVALACSTGAPEVTDSGNAVERQGLSTSSDVSGSSLALARSMVERSLPEWTPSAIVNTPSPSRAGPAFERPREMAQGLVSERLEYAESRMNGRDVYRDARGRVTVKADAGRGYWKMISPVPGAEARLGGFSLSDAEAAARQVFDAFALPPEEAGAVYARDIAVRFSEEEVVIDSRHVRIEPKVNGLRVPDSQLMVTYGLDGTPFRVEVRWPPFRLKPVSSLKPRAQAAEAIAQAVAQAMDAGRKVDKVVSQLVYDFDEEEKTFEPVVKVGLVGPETATLRGPLEYSLVSGLRTSERSPDPIHGVTLDSAPEEPAQDAKPLHKAD